MNGWKEQSKRIVLDCGKNDQVAGTEMLNLSKRTSFLGVSNLQVAAT